MKERKITIRTSDLKIIVLTLEENVPVERLIEFLGLEANQDDDYPYDYTTDYNYNQMLVYLTQQK